MCSPKEKKKASLWINCNPYKKCFFLSFDNLAESEVGDSQNLTGFNTDSLGRMSDSEASNEGYYVHKFIKRYQFYSLFPPSCYLLLINMTFGVIIITAPFKLQFSFK